MRLVCSQNLPGKKATRHLTHLRPEEPPKKLTGIYWKEWQGNLRTTAETGRNFASPVVSESKEPAVGREWARAV